MHKKTLKRSTFNTLTQKIKAPEHLSRLSDYEDTENESVGRCQLPSLQKKKSWKDADSVSSWDQSSRRTSVSWSPEMEDVATWKVTQQWEAVERTLYDEPEQVAQTSVLEECIQWRTQVPHLRVIGRNPFLSVKDKVEDVDNRKLKGNSELQDQSPYFDHSFSGKERSSSSRCRSSFKAIENDVFNIIFEHVVSQLFPKKGDDYESLSGNLSDMLRISPAPVHVNKSSARSVQAGKVNWTEETICLEDKISNNKNRMTRDPLFSVKTEILEINKQKKFENPLSGNKLRDLKGTRNNTPDNAGTTFCRPHTSRNKLGTVFNEKIVVSPVPYVLSTKESFSTLRTTPIKVIAQPFDVSTFQGSARNISSFGNYMRKSTPLGASTGQSAWHAPVSPAIWPKNIKLAPIDTSRLPSRKNRSLAPSPAVLQRHRKSLSPISRSTLPVSAQSARDRNIESLEIQGKHITPGQSAKLSLLRSGWDYSPKAVNSGKKKQRVKKEAK